MSFGKRAKGTLFIIAISTIVTACSNETAVSPANAIGAPSSQFLKSAIAFRNHFLFHDRLPRAYAQLNGTKAPAAAAGGIYVNEANETSIFGYGALNHKKPPICTAPYSVLGVSDIASDNQGDVIVAQGTGQIIIGQGPGMCGGVAATINEQYGPGMDASSSDALNGLIAVAVAPLGPPSAGGVAVCSVASGCTEELTNPAIDLPLGVAIDSAGNCWLDAQNSQNEATLTEFAGCSGAGVQATQFQNTSFGGIEIDKWGNLITFDPGPGNVDVYKGCNPQCTLISSTKLQNPAYFGHLNEKGDRLVVAAFLAGQIDIYKYRAKKIKYLYSFNSGLTVSGDVLGVTYNKRSRE